METTLVNIAAGRCEVYIGRGSPYGNPYMIGPDGDRREVIRLYKIYFHARLDRDPEFASKVQALRGRVLGCHCSPRACHGDVILEYLNSPR